MADTDWLANLIPVIIGTIGSAGFMALFYLNNRLKHSSDSSITGTIELHHLDSGVKNLEARTCKDIAILNTRIDKEVININARIDITNRELKVEIDRVHVILEDLKYKVGLNTYRIDDHKERLNKIERANGYHKGAVS